MHHFKFCVKPFIGKYLKYLHSNILIIFVWFRLQIMFDKLYELICKLLFTQTVPVRLTITTCSLYVNLSIVVFLYYVSIFSKHFYVAVCMSMYILNISFFFTKSSFAEKFPMKYFGTSDNYICFSMQTSMVNLDTKTNRIINQLHWIIPNILSKYRIQNNTAPLNTACFLLLIHLKHS